MELEKHQLQGLDNQKRGQGCVRKSMGPLLVSKFDYDADKISGTGCGTNSNSGAPQEEKYQ